MAGEALLINPRRRRRRTRRKKASSHRRPRRRRVARRNPFAMNPRRRRRRVARRGHRRARRRVHRNPRLPLLGNVNIAAITGGAVGYIGTRYGTGWALSVIPPQWSADPNTAPLVRIGVKALVGIVGIPMLLRFIPGARKFAGPAAIGGGIAVAVDLFETYLAKMVPIPMADYEQQVLTDYETRALTGTDDGSPGFIQGGAFGSSAYGGGAF